EQVGEWFELSEESPYMLLVAEVAAARNIPAVTHVDRSGRIQTVGAATNPRVHALISEFHRITGCPVVVNTSFNVRGQPIVCTPEEAFACFMDTDIEILAVGNCLLRKDRQDRALATRRQFEPD